MVRASVRVSRGAWVPHSVRASSHNNRYLSFNLSRQTFPAPQQLPAIALPCPLCPNVFIYLQIYLFFYLKIYIFIY